MSASPDDKSRRERPERPAEQAAQYRAAQYRAKVEKLRATANDLENEATRLELWDVAAEYDKMAHRAEQRPPDLPAGMDQAPTPDF